MIKRIIIALFLFGIIGGGTWYLLRSNPAKSVEKLRIKIDKLLKSSDLSEWQEVTSGQEQSAGDLNDKDYRLTLARETSDMVLDINPKSEYDLNIRALIEEYSGNPVEALKWYGKISKLKKPSAGNDLRRARLLKRLGLHQAAKGAVSGVVDVYPFESNFQLGQLYLETYQPLEAYKAFYRAQKNTTNDDEIRRVLEGMAQAINRLISSSRIRLAKLRASGAHERQIGNLEATIERFEHERDKTLDNAIELLKKVQPRSRSEFVAVQVKLFELLNTKGDSSNLEISKQSLLDAVRTDDDFRYFPIYLLLGSLDLQQAYSQDIPISKRQEFIHSAEAHYQKVFAFDFEGKSAKVADIAEWSFPKEMTSVQFEAEILLKICGSLLKNPEFWRILSEKDPDGNQDSLQIHKRINELIQSDLNKNQVTPLVSMVAISHLKNNDLQFFNRKIEELELENSENREKIAIEIAKGIAHYVPTKTEVLIDFLEKRILKDLDFSEGNENDSIDKLKTAVGLLNQARNALFSFSRNTMSVETLPDETVMDSERLIGQKIKEYASKIAQNTSNPNEVLYASKLLISALGTQEAIEILEQADAKFPDSHSIANALGLAYLDVGNSKSEDELLRYYKRALKEFVKLYIVRPYKTEVLSRLLHVSRVLDSKQHFNNVTVSEILGDLYPNSSKESREILGKALRSFLLRDFQGVVDEARPQKNTLQELQPFLNLIVGISYLERAGTLLKQKMTENPVLSTKKVGEDGENVRELFTEHYTKARQEFEEGMAIDSSYLPFHLELFKMDLNRLKPGEELPANLTSKIEGLAKEHPGVSQVHFLHANFIKKQREALVASNPELKDISGNVTKERTILRRAIKTNPAFVDAYIALAETYVISWRLSTGILKDYKNVYKKLGSPEFDVAISVLLSAPSVPQVMRLIATYYEEDKKPEKAIEYYKALLIQEPISANVSKVVQSYLSRGDFESAREWLKSIDPSKIHGENFEVTKNTLMAHITSVESESSATSDLRRDDLVESQIEQYRSIIDQANKLGQEPPLLVVNNLAYLLADRGKPEESVKLIEPVIKRLSKTPGSNRIEIFQNIRDTYAWSLFKSGANKEALKIYESLCSQETRLDIHLNYAKALVDEKRYQDALHQVNIILNSENAEKRKFEEETRNLQQQIELAIGK